MNRIAKLILLLSALISTYAFGHPKKNEQSLDRIVAVVNKTVITQSELNEAIDRIKTQLSATHTPEPPADVLRKQVLGQLIDRKIQLDLAEQAGIHVTDEEVTQAIKGVAEKNRITTDKLLAAVETQGLSKTEYRKEIHDEIAINQLAQHMVGSKINISQQEVDDFMRSAAWRAYNSKEYHLEDILIALPEKPSSTDIANAKSHAEAILRKIHNGQSFREAAVAESSGSQALQGGDLGWRKLPEVPTAFAGKLVSMKEDDVAGPIQTANGFHIIHVAGIRGTSMQGGKAEQRKQVQDLLYQRKYEEALQNWVAKLRSESFINTHPEN